MKTINLTLATLALGLSAQATDLDQFVGKYKAGKDTEATIKKVLVEEATLFDPAKYEYEIDFQSSSRQLSFEKVMTPDAEGKKLVIENFEEECQDPGCIYFTDVGVELSAKKNRIRTQSPKITLKVTYEGYQECSGLEEDECEGEFSGEFILKKVAR